MNTTLIILAGGKAKRIGSLGQIYPKVSLLAYDQPLLIRQIEQAIEAKVPNIIVSVNKQNHLLIRKLISYKTKSRSEMVKILLNPFHNKGSLSALSFVLKATDAKKIILSFGDIYFIQNPFKGVVDLIKSDATYLFGAKPTFKQELLLGGIIDVNINNQVIMISEKAKPITCIGYRWNGLALFDKKKHYQALKSFLKRVSFDIAEEQYFANYNEVHQNILFHQSTDFINVNTFEDLYLSTSLRFQEVFGKHTGTNLQLYQYIANLRRFVTKTKVEGNIS